MLSGIAMEHVYVFTSLLRSWALITTNSEFILATHSSFPLPTK